MIQVEHCPQCRKPFVKKGNRLICNRCYWSGMNSLVPNEQVVVLNCRRCRLPFKKLRSEFLCNTCVEQEYEDYKSAYRKLSVLIRRLDDKPFPSDDRLDMTRVRETLAYRLGFDGSYDLPMWRRGVCYICQHRMANPAAPEPMCLECLEHVVHVFEKSEAVLYTKSRAPQGRSKTRAGRHGVVAHADPEFFHKGDDPFETEEPSPTLLPVSTVQGTHGVHAVPTMLNDVLLILAQDDNEENDDSEGNCFPVEIETVPWLADMVLEVEKNGELRHYGFKRD